MKSAIYLGKENIEIQNRPMPELGNYDVLIKNIYSSICGTDVAVYKHGENTGHRITVGEEFGHETISKVVAIGDKVTEFKVGERVYPYPRFAIGDTKRAGTIGGFSEYIKIQMQRKIILYIMLMILSLIKSHALLNHSLLGAGRQDVHNQNKVKSLLCLVVVQLGLQVQYH